jgi:oxaloacetate decarboxylase gamma subunit
MSESGLMIESLRLMGIGMGIVFCFLLLLVGILRGMSWTAQRLAPPEQTPASAAAAAIAGQGDQSNDLIAVISAAIARYRAGR